MNECYIALQPAPLNHVTSQTHKGLGGQKKNIFCSCDYFAHIFCDIFSEWMFEILWHADAASLCLMSVTGYSSQSLVSALNYPFYYDSNITHQD